MYSALVRKRAVGLRLRGKTYTEIASKLKVAKSSLSLWLRDLPFPKESTSASKKKYFLKFVQPKGALANHNKKLKMWDELHREAKEEVKILPMNYDFLRSLLVMLYWAEGSKFDKGGISFVNTDPRIASLFITLLRHCYEIDESRLRVRLHLHWYHSITNTRNYWATLLNVPGKQIQKVYIKKRNRSKRFRKNFMGICFIRYNDSRMRRSMLAYAFALQAKIAPIAQGIERVPAEDEAGGSNPPRRAINSKLEINEKRF